MSKIIEQVMQDLQDREARGLSKYGTTVDRTDLSKQEWLQHAYEEALDMAVYLKRAMSEGVNDGVNEGISKGKSEKFLACEKYLKELPEGYRERALSQMDAEFIETLDIVNTTEDALFVFTKYWSKTKEGKDFWREVAESCFNNRKTLPPLPND